MGSTSSSSNENQEWNDCNALQAQVISIKFVRRPIDSFGGKVLNFFSKDGSHFAVIVKAQQYGKVKEIIIENTEEKNVSWGYYQNEQYENNGTLSSDDFKEPLTVYQIYKACVGNGNVYDFTTNNCVHASNRIKEFLEKISFKTDRIFKILEKINIQQWLLESINVLIKSYESSKSSFNQSQQVIYNEMIKQSSNPEEFIKLFKRLNS